MSDLIKALTILLKYADPPYPTGCGHDVLRVYVDPLVVTEEDKTELEHLGFHAWLGGSDRHFYSDRFGSC